MTNEALQALIDDTANALASGDPDGDALAGATLLVTLGEALSLHPAGEGVAELVGAALGGPAARTKR